MLRAPTHDELARDAFYVRDSMCVERSTPVGRIFTALEIPGEWTTPSLERALQYAFRLCYDPRLRSKVLEETALAVLPSIDPHKSHPSEAYIVFELHAGVTAARLEQPTPPIVPAAFRVPGTNLAVLATRYLIWKTKRTCPQSREPYLETLRFVRALKYEDRTGALGARYPRYHVFVAIVATLVHNAMERMAEPVPTVPKTHPFFRSAEETAAAMWGDAVVAQIPNGGAAHYRTPSAGSCQTPYELSPLALVAAQRAGAPTVSTGSNSTTDDARGSSDLNSIDEGQQMSSSMSESYSESHRAQARPRVNANGDPIVVLRLPEFKLEISVRNTDTPLEVRSLLEAKSFAPKVAYYLDRYVPSGLTLAARTSDGNLKPFRLGVDGEAWATPPAEVQPLRLRVAVFLQCGSEEPKKLMDRTLLARYSNGMEVWPTLADPYRLQNLATKMQDHVRNVAAQATSGLLDDTTHSCAVFVSTSALWSTASQTSPRRGSLGRQIVETLLRLAKADVDFEGRVQVKIYVPSVVFGAPAPPAPEQPVNYVSDESPGIASGHKRLRSDLEPTDQVDEHRDSASTAYDDIPPPVHPAHGYAPVQPDLEVPDFDFDHVVQTQ